MRKFGSSSCSGKVVVRRNQTPHPPPPLFHPQVIIFQIPVRRGMPRDYKLFTHFLFSHFAHQESDWRGWGVGGLPRAVLGGQEK